MEDSTVSDKMGTYHSAKIMPNAIVDTLYFYYCPCAREYARFPPPSKVSSNSDEQILKSPLETDVQAQHILLV